MAIPALVALIFVVTACGDGDRSVDPSRSRAVSFATSDAVRLEGRLFGDGERAVVLAHGYSADQRVWFPLADRLADDGFLVLTFDFRGTCPGGQGGCSAGTLVAGELWRDVIAAVDYLRSERAASSVSLVGSSMGATASLVAAAQPGVDVRAVISLSAPLGFQGLRVDPTLLSQVTAAKLFIAGVGDAPAAASAETMYEQAPPPKRVEIVPADEHGADLLDGGQGEVVRRMIETYLETNAA